MATWANTRLAAGPGSPNKRSISFGRIGWNAAGHAKWVHGRQSDRLFLGAEIWAPSWTECQRRETAPDIFVKLENADAWGSSGVLPASVLLAVAKDLPVEIVGRAYPNTRAIEAAMGGGAVAHSLRPWAVGFGKAHMGMFTDSLQDLFATGIFALREGRASPYGAALAEGWRWL